MLKRNDMRLREATAVKSPILIRERRKALVQAAIAVFSAKGYHTSTVNEVARAAGLSQGSVYNYIGSKADILYLVCSDVYAAFEQSIRDSIADAATPLERLSRAIDATVDVSFRIQDHLMLLYQELHCLERTLWRPFLRDAAGLRRIYEEILKEVAESEGMDFANCRVVANIILGLPSAVIMRRWDLRGKVPEPEMRAILARMMRRSLGLPDERRGAASPKPKSNRAAKRVARSPRAN